MVVIAIVRKPSELGLQTIFTTVLAKVNEASGEFNNRLAYRRVPHLKVFSSTLPLFKSSLRFKVFLKY